MIEYDWFYFPDILNYNGTINPSRFVDWLNEMQENAWELVELFKDDNVAVFKRKRVPDGQDRLL